MYTQYDEKNFSLAYDTGTDVSWRKMSNENSNIIMDIIDIQGFCDVETYSKKSRGSCLLNNATNIGLWCCLIQLTINPRE